MRIPSLKLRLLLFASVTVTLALALTAAGLVLLFSRHVERRIDQELETYLNQLAGNLAFAPDSRSFSFSRRLADPRFDRPLSGLYWRAKDAKTGAIQRSRSLWDSDFDLPKDDLGVHMIHHHVLKGPGGGTIIVAEQEIAYPRPDGTHKVRIAVALDRSELRNATADFARDLLPSVVLLAAFLLAATWIQISLGLKPLQAIRQGLAAIREGHASRLEGDFPDEVRPLVTEANTLLAEQERAMEHARSRAADLAHGLKTPLTVLGGHARRLIEAGNAQAGEDLNHLVADMRRHVDHQLALARLHARGHGRHEEIALAPLLKAITRTLDKTPKGEALSWTIDCPAEIAVAVDHNDLTELLGNILDNATKWARSHISVAAQEEDGTTTLVIADDGPGFPASAGASLGERGARFDESAPGTGIGLAIVRDIARSYDITLRFTNARQGGAKVSLTFPKLVSTG